MIQKQDSLKITVGCLCKNKTACINTKIEIMRYLLSISFAFFILMLSFRSAQEFVVKGIVKDATSGSPLSGVTITLKPTNTVAVTGSDGKFSLTVQKEKTMLIFSAVGYTKKEVPAINDGKEITVSLKQSTAVLDEVVVAGHGRTKKRILTVLHLSLNLRQPAATTMIS